MNRSLPEIVAGLVDPGIIAVIRAPNPDCIPSLVEALLAGGVRAMEITLSTPNAFGAIHQARKRFALDALVGVGTVLNPEQATAALDAGAEFVVTPILRPELVPLAHAAGRPIMLGAYTPTEVQTAHESGADFVKLFPAEGLGAGYIKALRAPLPHLRLVPTGGVYPANAAELIRAGCAALGAGSSLIPAQALRAGDWPAITQLAREFVEAVQSARETPRSTPPPP